MGWGHGTWNGCALSHNAVGACAVMDGTGPNIGSACDYRLSSLIDVVVERSIEVGHHLGAV